MPLTHGGQFNEERDLGRNKNKTKTKERKKEKERKKGRKNGSYVRYLVLLAMVLVDVDEGK